MFKYWEKYGELKFETGERLYFPHADNLALGIVELYKEVSYDPPPIEIRPNEVVVDVGGYVGLFGLYAARKVGQFGKVVSIEPLPHIYEILEANWRVNKLPQWHIINKAVGDKSEQRKIYFHSASPEMGYFGETDGKLRLDASVEVSTATLEQIMDNYKITKIDFLKMNCEGAEGVIIPSIQSSTWKNIKKAAIQLHDDLLNVSPDELMRIFSNNGFSSRIFIPKFPFRNKVYWVHLWRA